MWLIHHVSEDMFLNHKCHRNTIQSTIKIDVNKSTIIGNHRHYAVEVPWGFLSKSQFSASHTYLETIFLIFTLSDLYESRGLN